jgi:lysophospholipase L1-like esterase
MKRYSYLALGDSYTIGEAVPPQENFPSLLVAALDAKTGFKGEKPHIVATTGWTTDELLSGIEEAAPSGIFQIVSLLIGVNNQYRGYACEQYRREFQILLQKAIGFAGGHPERVFVVSIPDYGCTPFGESKAEEIHLDLCWYNEEARLQAIEAGTAFADIFPYSRLAATRPELTATDQLHPSPEMYAGWVEIMLPAALAILEKQQTELAQ